MIAKHHDDPWTWFIPKVVPSDINRSERVQETMTTSSNMVDDINSHGKPNKVRRHEGSHKRHDLAHHGRRRLKMRLHGKRLS